MTIVEYLKNPDFIFQIPLARHLLMPFALREGLVKDHAKTEVNRISPLGLVEMTRARTGKTIESLEFHDCPYCEGRGKVKIN